MTTKIETDKARYSPGEAVRITLINETGFSQARTLPLTVYAPGAAAEPETAYIPARENGDGILEIDWQAPAADFCGYLLSLTTRGANGEELTFEIAVDVSSSWLKFPRYGYLWDFTEHADAEGKIRALNRYHINGLQYYDWQYRHHQPLSAHPEKWQDWSGRWIYGGVVRRYIAAARERGMANMAYNMIYAANKTYLTDGSGVSPEWRLIKAGGEDFGCEMGAENGDTGALQFFNPLNPEWQRYIFQKETEALDAMGFDGWHGDTIGEYGAMTTAGGGPLGTDENGQPVNLVKDGYTVFLNKAKDALGNRCLTFNPVGAQGIEKVSASRVDVLYSEFWPWEKSRWGETFDTYHSLQKEIFDAARVSGGKSLVTATYANYRAPQPYFNPAAVRLLDAVVYASGGSRIELGNGDNMLSNEYFPGDVDKKMGEALRLDTVRIYDFVTAYQNLLRGGQTPAERAIVLEGTKSSADGQSDAVWTFAMEGEGMETVHFINLSGTDNLWQDAQQKKPEPTQLYNVRVRYYTDFGVRSVHLATPDGGTLLPRALEFEIKQDGNGRCITFTMPSLACWNMVFMR